MCCLRHAIPPPPPLEPPDIAFYGLSLNNATILSASGYSTTNATTTYQYIYNTAIGNMIIVLAGAVPGYWATIATVDTLGRKLIQFAGFTILTSLFAVMGVAYSHLSPTPSWQSTYSRNSSLILDPTLLPLSYQGRCSLRGIDPRRMGYRRRWGGL
jgi:hypothetical protein